MKKEGKLIVLSAPSGSGKTTLVRYLLEQKMPLGFSISATTRAPRGQEKNKRDYYFLSKDTFQSKIAENAFLEYEEVYPGSYYGTLKSELNRLWDAGLHVLFDIDVQGGFNIKKQYPEQTLAIFIQPPSMDVLEQRLLARGTDTEGKIRTRLEKAKEELSYASKFDRILLNDDLEAAQKKLYKLIQKFLST